MKDRPHMQATLKRNGKKTRQLKTTSLRPAFNPSQQKHQWQATLQGAAKDGIAVVLLAISAFILLSLLSYSAQDPAWSRSGSSSKEIINWMGPMGAWLSDVMYSLWGNSALWFPAMTVYGGWRLLRVQQARLKWDPWALSVRVSGFVLVLIASCITNFLYFHQSTSDLAYSSGGIVGLGIANNLFNYVGSHGTLLIVIALLFAGIPLLANTSWLTICDEVGRWMNRLIRKVMHWLNLGWQLLHKKYQQKKMLADELTIMKEKLASNEPPISQTTILSPFVAAQRKIATLLTSKKHLEQSITASEDTETLPIAKVDLSEDKKESSFHGEPPLNDSSHNKVAINSLVVDDLVAKFTPKTSTSILAQDSIISNSWFFSALDGEDDPVSAESYIAPKKDWPLEEDGLATESLSKPALFDDLEESSNPQSSEQTAKISELEDDNHIINEPLTTHKSTLSASVSSVIESATLPQLWTVEHLQQRPEFSQAEANGPLPSFELLTEATAQQPSYSNDELQQMADMLEKRLNEYGVKAEVVKISPGPVITQFEVRPAAGVKSAKISNLAKDLARSLLVKSVRVIEVIYGRPTVGIEIPNPQRAIIRLRQVIDSTVYQQASSPLTIALGQNISGQPIVADLARMPHLLVAGTTGSGKSVGLNAMLISLLLKATPEQVRLILIDPKMLELSVYDAIPHLLTPVVTDMKQAANALRWCVAEMERRYKLMSKTGVRNILSFNARLDEAHRAGAEVADPLWEPQPWEMHQRAPTLQKLPYIVVVIDEFADMFMIVGKKVEELIARLAQKARAAGIHLILATQRPSVDVVTGLIKANIPSRIAFQVSSKIDSRTILDQGGAESLLGHGDMLYSFVGSGTPMRVHGAYVDDKEVIRVVENWKLRGEPTYEADITTGEVNAEALAGLEADHTDSDAEQDVLYDEAVVFITQTQRVSVSSIQRKFKIGYNRASRLVEAMEKAGLVSPMSTNGTREVLVSSSQRY